MGVHRGGDGLQVVLAIAQERRPIVQDQRQQGPLANLFPLVVARWGHVGVSGHLAKTIRELLAAARVEAKGGRRFDVEGLYRRGFAAELKAAKSVILGTHAPDPEAGGFGQQGVKHPGGDTVVAPGVQQGIDPGLLLVVTRQEPLVEKAEQGLGLVPGVRRASCRVAGLVDQAHQLPLHARDVLRGHPGKHRCGGDEQLQGQGLGSVGKSNHQGEGLSAGTVRPRSRGGCQRTCEDRDPGQKAQHSRPAVPADVFHVCQFIGILVGNQP